MPLSLEIFETDPKATPGRIVLDQIALAREQTASFDNGYRAGWQEANASAAAHTARCKADLSQHLQSLSFTYHEAQAHVLTALQPLFQHMVEHILPRIAHDALAAKIVETLAPFADRMGHTPLILRVNPARQST
ncbi:MAG: flagellar biosynthesis protein, partial [Pseudomonadota bacterium]